MPGEGGRGAGLREPDGRGGGGSSAPRRATRAPPRCPNRRTRLSRPAHDASLFWATSLTRPGRPELPPSCRAPRPQARPAARAPPAPSAGDRPPERTGTRLAGSAGGRRQVGRREGSQVGARPQLPARRKPRRGGFICRKGATGPSGYLPCLLRILPRADRHSGSRPSFPVQLFGKRILLTVWSIPNQPETLLMTGDPKAHVVLTGGLLT